MVKYRRRYYRRNYSNYYNTFLKSIARYHYTKLTCFGQILLDQTGIKFAVNSSQILLASTALNSCNDWEKYKNLFLSYKVRGIKVTLVPNIDQGIDFRGTASFGYVSNSDETSVGDTLESNKSLLLNPQQQTSAYWPLTNGLTGWINNNSTNQTNGKFQCAATSNATAGGLIWSYKIDFYVMYKNTV